MPSPSPEASADSSDSKALKILLVDDHPDTSRVFQLLLEKKGYSVVTANTVQSALEAARNSEFDLLVSDIGLPDGTGHDLMRQVQQIRKLRGIALSGFGMDEDMQRSEEAGFAKHLTKPVSFQKLVEAIAELI